jgi:chromosome segregation ATPase
MDLPDRLQRALQRLNGALEALDAAVERRAEADAARADADTEYDILQDDRSRLAVELDAALARSRALERTLDQVSDRLEQAEATMNGILEDMSSKGAGAASGSA